MKALAAFAAKGCALALLAYAACRPSLPCAPAHAATPTVDSEDAGAAAISELLSASRSPEAASALDPHVILAGPARPDSGFPLQPAHDFLRAEVERLRAETDRAYATYLEVISAALRGPGSGCALERSLATVSLLRAASLLAEAPQPDAEEARRLIESSIVLSAQSRGRLDVPVLGGLPGLMEALHRDLALLAWASGDTASAGRVFLEYIATASVPELGRVETELADYLAARGILSPHDLALIRGRHFYAARKYEHARRFLNTALDAGKAETRSEAGYLLARIRSVQGASRTEILHLLTAALEEAVDADLIQEILLYRAGVYDRVGRERNVGRFAADLEEIISRFPDGARADDAIHELANHYEKEGDTDEALRQLARLRDHRGPNDWLDSSHFRAALMLYSRAGPDDVAGATDLLRRLTAINPGGDLTLPARFWLGRMAEDLGDTASARQSFEAVIVTCPYDYYAIRARMHLNLGPEAARETWPDVRTMAVLSAASGAGTAGAAEGAGPDGPVEVHACLRAALEGGLYAEAIEADRRLRTGLPEKHQGEFSIEDLDRAGIFSAASLLLGLRLEAIAAATEAGGRSRLAVADAVRRMAGDTPAAMLLVFGLDRSVATQSTIQCDPGYPAVAYPPVYTDLITGAAHTHGVSPELLYAVMRRESLFYPAAVSRRGALGLFQFIPSTFATLDRRWRLLHGSGMTSMEGFLRDPGLTIDLGARWFKDELLDRNRGDVMLAVMEHNAGYPALRNWRKAWERDGRLGDVEYMIETAGFTETRIFTRSVLSDMVVARAAGLFETRADPLSE